MGFCLREVLEGGGVGTPQESGRRREGLNINLRVGNFFSRAEDILSATDFREGDQAEW